MDIAAFRARLKEGTLGGAYIFAGEEDYLKRYYMNELCRAAAGDEAFALFNRASFDGGEVPIPSVAEAICSPPMMADWKLVEWRYPAPDKMRESEREAFFALGDLTRAHPETVFVVFVAAEDLDCGTARRPSAGAKRLEQSFFLLNFEKSTDAQLLSWLKRHFDAEGIAVDAQTLSQLLMRVGHSMTLLSGEIEKLSAYLKANGQSRLTEEAIAVVVSATEEFDSFALSNAITGKDREKAFAALHDMERRKVEAGAAQAILARVFAETLAVSLLLDEGKDAAAIEVILRKKPYVVKLAVAAARRFGSEKLAAALSALRAADGAAKSGGIGGYAALELFLAAHL